MAAPAPDPAFPLGVASGDPRPHGGVVWTRVEPDVGGPHPRVRLTVRGPDDPRPLLTRELHTDASRDWTVAARLDTPVLRPGTRYRYVFHAEAAGRTHASRVGLLHTLPDPDASLDRLRLGVLSCQDHSNGWFSTLRHLAAAPVDYVVHLGDAIYETVASPTFQGRGPDERRLTLPSGRARAETLDDYRALWRAYRRDPDLQRLLAAHTFLPVWDDHEFANDGYGTHDTDSDDPAANDDPARRAAATRAWHEYQPVDVPYDPALPPLEQIRVQRSFVFGDLAELFLTDERLYRDGPPCGVRPQDRYATPGCPGLHAEDRTMLGAAQRTWLLDGITGSRRRWKVWANETMLLPLRLPVWVAARVHPGAGTPAPGASVLLSVDQWDGFPRERQRIAAAVRDAGTRDVVVLTGDLHAFVTGTLGDERDGAGVAACLMVGSATSTNLAEFVLGRALPSLPGSIAWALRGANPHLGYLNSWSHGHMRVDITPEAVTARMVVTASVTHRRSGAYGLATFDVAAGSPAVRRRRWWRSAGPGRGTQAAAGTAPPLPTRRRTVGRP